MVVFRTELRGRPEVLRKKPKGEAPATGKSASPSRSATAPFPANQTSPAVSSATKTTPTATKAPGSSTKVPDKSPNPAKSSKAGKTPGIKTPWLDKYFAAGWRPRFVEYMLVALLLLCFAFLTKRIGQADILGDQGLGQSATSLLPVADILYYVGSSIESFFPLIVAFLLAFAAAKRPNAAMGMAVVATWAGYMGSTTAISRYIGAVTTGQGAGINLGFFGGILVGAWTAIGWTTFRFRKVAPQARMISGIPLAILLCATGGVVLGIMVGVGYQLAYLAVVLGLGAVFLNSPAPVAVALYAFLHPFAEVAGLGKLLDTVPFKQYGSCQNDNGDPLNGSYVCFIYGGKQLEGQQSLFLSGGYPVVGFGLTALFLVLWIQLKGKNRQYWAIAYWMMAIATFLSGMDSAALYLFALAAPRLLLAHAVVSVVSYTVTALLVVTIGWAGGPGLIDLIRWFPSGDGLPFLAILGVVFAAVYAMLAMTLVVHNKKPSLLGGYGTAKISKPFMSLLVPDTPGPNEEDLDPAPETPAAAPKADSVLDPVPTPKPPAQPPTSATALDPVFAAPPRTPSPLPDFPPAGAGMAPLEVRAAPFPGKAGVPAGFAPGGMPGVGYPPAETTPADFIAAQALNAGEAFNFNAGMTRGQVPAAPAGIPPLSSAPNPGITPGPSPFTPQGPMHMSTPPLVPPLSGVKNPGNSGNSVNPAFPGPVPGQGQVPGQALGAVPGQAPGAVLGQVPGQAPGQAGGALPGSGQLPGAGRVYPPRLRG